MGTQQKLVKEVGLRELYQVDNPYKKRLQASYKAYKTSDTYKQGKLSEEEYMLDRHQTRPFAYQSISDDQAAFEGVRDLALGAGVVILTIFCPPAGAVAGVALASADMYSAAVGKDWMTGRELDATERGLRAGFALFDLVPGVGYAFGLGKDGLKAGLTGIKATLRESFEQGMKQGAKNVDNLKHLSKNLDNFGKNVVKQVDDWGRQVDNLANRTVISGAEELSAALRTADSVISEAAQNFRLNIENVRNAFVPQFAYETVEIADDVVKNADEVSQLNRVANKIDEFVEARRANISPSIDDSFKQLNVEIEVLDLPEGTWQKSGFQRGKDIDNMYNNIGGNYPVIDIFDGSTGTATSVKSRDLTGKTYQKPYKLKSIIKKDIDTLAAFDGTDWNGLNTIGKIKSKQLTIVVPNTKLTAGQIQAINEVIEYGASKGIKINIVIGKG